MLMGRRANIATAGLTAAGKTTHGKLLATQLGYEYVSATDVLLELAGLGELDSEQAWFSAYDKIQKAREGYSIDIELERRLNDLAASRDGVVFDTWALAWISPSPMIRIWIESDLPSRARKCYVSQREPLLDLQQCQELIERKDQESRENFLERHDFDLFVDRGKYHLILDNSMLIPEPIHESSRAGIETFAPVVRMAVSAVASNAPDVVAELVADNPRYVKHARALTHGR